jgi:hypothetical protein
MKRRAVRFGAAFAASSKTSVSIERKFQTQAALAAKNLGSVPIAIRRDPPDGAREREIVGVLKGMGAHDARHRG